MKLAGQVYDKQDLKKNTLSLKLLRVGWSCASCAKQVLVITWTLFLVLHYIQCWQCFVLSRRIKVKRHKALTWLINHRALMSSTPSWDKTTTSPKSATFSWSHAWLWRVMLTVEWRAARPFVWPESAWWGWRSPRLAQSARELEGEEGRSAGRLNETPDGGERIER